MLKLIIKQTNWGIAGAVFGFSIGFFVKIYLIDIVGLSAWGKYVSAHTFATAADAFLSIGIPFVLIKFIPNYLESNKEKANQLIRKCLRYATKISITFLILMYFLAPFFDNYIYKEIDSFSLILLLVSIHAPISIFTGIITSLYRSVFKIKEIIIYSTFVAVPIRALLTFFIFKYTNNIIYFVGIELFTTSLTMFLLYYFFSKNEMNFTLIKSEEKQKTEDNVIQYGKNIYANSVVVFFATQSLSLILSIMLPPKQIGIYSILLTITGISMFLIMNLNKIFAPAIAKLYEENNISELNVLYKKTTFIVNLLTVPFSILIIIFAKDILSLYDKSGELDNYVVYLYVLMGARIISLLAGSSGTFMIMAGLEKRELQIQSVKAILITVLALLFTNKFGLSAIVSLFIFFMFFVNVLQLIFIKKHINISPFSNDLYLLILISIPLGYFAISYNFDFRLYHYFLIPIFVYLLYGVVFIKQIIAAYKENKND